MPNTQNQPVPNGQDQEFYAMTQNEEIEFFRSIGRLEAQVAALASSLTEMKAKLDTIDTRLDALDRLANRWKGGFAVILSLGAVTGFLINNLLRWWSNQGS